MIVPNGIGLRLIASVDHWGWDMDKLLDHPFPKGMGLHILALSNGHGEDTIGAQILQAVQREVATDAPRAHDTGAHDTGAKRTVTVTALPLVGEGKAYERAGIDCISPVRSHPPSGGFLYMDFRQLWGDLQNGLVGVTLRQWQLVKTWTQTSEKSGGQPLVLEVGDIVPLLFAWRSQAPYSFVGTAKSEYYLRDSNGEFLRSRRSEGWSGSVYLPWERWLMARPRCKAVFPRDRLTTDILKQWAIPALDLGNPMMDGFLPFLEGEPLAGPPTVSPNPPPSPDEPLKLLIIPGSRSPEAYRNWTQLLELGTAIAQDWDGRPVEIQGAIAPGLDLNALNALIATLATPWQSGSIPNTWHRGTVTLQLSVGQFYEQALNTHIGLAMAGTATEQLVGLGQPIVTMAGQGPQFTPAFAEAQTRLLGSSILLVDTVDEGVKTVRSLLETPQQWSAITQNGRDRLGVPGAAKRIAQHFLKLSLEPRKITQA